MSGYRLDNFDFKKADPLTRPKRVGPGGRVVDVEKAKALYDLVKDGDDATDGISYDTEQEARSVSQAASRLLRVGISNAKMDQKYTSSTRVFIDPDHKGKWVYRVFLKEIAEENLGDLVGN